MLVDVLRAKSFEIWCYCHTWHMFLLPLHFEAPVNSTLLADDEDKDLCTYPTFLLLVLHLLEYFSSKACLFLVVSLALTS